MNHKNTPQYTLLFQLQLQIHAKSANKTKILFYSQVYRQKLNFINNTRNQINLHFISKLRNYMNLNHKLLQHTNTAISGTHCNQNSQHAALRSKKTNGTAQLNQYRKRYRTN